MRAFSRPGPGRIVTVAVCSVVTIVSATSATARPVTPSEPAPAQVSGTCWDHLPTKKKVVALTFDAGAGAGGVSSILKTLQAKNAPATFFLTGRWARQFPKKVARIAAGGYVLGNHTDTHRKVSTLSTSELRRELSRTNHAVKAAAGRGTKPWFRFPYGAHTQRDVDRVNELGYACIQWTVDTAGWMGTSGGQSKAGVVARVLKGLRPGEIVLMHVGEHPTDGSTLDADALPQIIDALRAKGYSFTSVADLLSVS